MTLWSVSLPFVFIGLICHAELKAIRKALEKIAGTQQKDDGQ